MIIRKSGQGKGMRKEWVLQHPTVSVSRHWCSKSLSFDNASQVLRKKVSHYGWQALSVYSCIQLDLV